MRTVWLDGRDGVCPSPRGEKLAGHLNARLEEYREEGISSRVSGHGAVTAVFAGRTGAEAAGELRRAGVFACPDGDGVRFVMGRETTFEELDYVQAAAATLPG